MILKTERFGFFLLITILFSCSDTSIKKEFYSNGNIKSISTINDKGQKHGVIKTFFEEGLIESELNYVNDVQEDTSRWYYIDGALEAKKCYRDGIEEGFGYEYETDGSLIKEVEYKKGKIVFAKNFKGEKVKKYKRIYIQGHFDTISIDQNYKIQIGIFESKTEACDSIAYLYKAPKLIENGVTKLDKTYRMVPDQHGEIGGFKFSPKSVGHYGFYIAAFECECPNDDESVLYEYKMDFTVVDSNVNLDVPDYIEGLVEGRTLVAKNASL